MPSAEQMESISRPVGQSNLKKKCFNQLASLLGFLILFNPFFLGYLLVPASAVEKSSGTITGDSWAKSGDLFLHSWFVLYTTRDVRPRSVVLITMLGLILWPFLVCAVWHVSVKVSSSLVVLVVCVYGLNLSGYGHN